MGFTIWLFPFIGAAIGWFTNYLAVRMIFRPREPRRILGLRIHGLLPRRRHEFAQSIAETVERELVSSDDVRRVLSQPETHRHVVDVIGSKLDQAIKNRLTDLPPMVKMFVNDDLIAKLRGGLVKELDSLVPEIMDGVLDNVEHQLDFKKMVHDRIEAFPMGQLEAIVLRIAKKELRSIEILGGVLGFLIGLIQVLLVLLTQGD
ncbi:MAG: DUF445 family protein [Planctomycetota bacterium]